MKRRVSSSMPRKERTVLGPSIFSRASGIPRLEAEDLMEPRLAWHSWELGSRPGRGGGNVCRVDGGGSIARLRRTG